MSAGNGRRHVGRNAKQPRRSLQSHLLCDGVSPITALSHVFRVAEAPHERVPRARDSRRIPTGRRRLARKSIARQRWNDDIERVRRGAAVSCGIGERLDDLQLFDDGAGPSVGDDERQRILFFRLHVNEVNVQSVDVGHELRQRVESRLTLSPVVVGRPIAGERLHGRELHTLRVVRDLFALGPARRFDATAEVGELGIGNVHAKWPDPRRFWESGIREFTQWFGHGFKSPKGAEDGERAGGHACHGGAAKTAAIEIASF